MPRQTVQGSCASIATSSSPSVRLVSGAACGGLRCFACLPDSSVHVVSVGGIHVMSTAHSSSSLCIAGSLPNGLFLSHLLRAPPRPKPLPNGWLLAPGEHTAAATCARDSPKGLRRRQGDNPSELTPTFAPRIYIVAGGTGTGATGTGAAHADAATPGCTKGMGVGCSCGCSRAGEGTNVRDGVVGSP